MNGWEKAGLYVLGAGFAASAEESVGARGWRRRLLLGLAIADAALAVSWVSLP